MPRILAHLDRVEAGPQDRRNSRQADPVGHEHDALGHPRTPYRVDHAEQVRVQEGLASEEPHPLGPVMPCQHRQVAFDVGGVDHALGDDGGEVAARPAREIAVLDHIDLALLRSDQPATSGLAYCCRARLFRLLATRHGHGGPSGRAGREPVAGALGAASQRGPLPGGPTAPCPLDDWLSVTCCSPPPARGQRRAAVTLAHPVIPGKGRQPGRCAITSPPPGPGGRGRPGRAPGGRSGCTPTSAKAAILSRSSAGVPASPCSRSSSTWRPMALGPPGHLVLVRAAAEHLGGRADEGAPGRARWPRRRRRPARTCSAQRLDRARTARSSRRRTGPPAPGCARAPCPPTTTGGWGRCTGLGRAGLSVSGSGAR